MDDLQCIENGEQLREIIYVLALQVYRLVIRVAFLEATFAPRHAEHVFEGRRVAREKEAVYLL